MGYSSIMFSLLILLLGCNASPENWEVCPSEDISYSGAEGSEFGFRLLSKEDSIFITAPSDCSTPLYSLDESGITPQDWNEEGCARWGQEITLQNNAPVLYGPLSETRWQNAESTLDIGSNSIRRLITLPDKRLVQLLPSTVKIGGIEHPLPTSSMDFATFQNHVAVLMRGMPTQIWTLEDTFVFEDNGSLYSRIHPFALDLAGRKQWVLGGGTDLTYTNGKTLFTVEIPEWSILKQDIDHHPHISIGYSSALLDFDNDGRLDWVVGAPTAGSGNNPAFPEQSGWVGWFEQDNRQWVLRQEWIGGSTFAHFGWSLGIHQTDTKRIVFAGSPGTSTVSNTICYQQVEK